MPPTRSAVARQAAVSSSQPTATATTAGRSGPTSSTSSSRHQQPSRQQPQSASQPLPSAHQPLIVPGPDDSDFLDSEADDLIDHDDADALGDDVDEPGPSSRTTTSAAGEAMPIRPLVHISPRMYFAVFPHPAPDMADLSEGDGSRAVVLPPADAQELEDMGRKRAVLQGGPPPLHKPKLKHWEWLTIDHDLPYLSFFDDWGPLNIGMFWRFCTHVHQWLIDPAYAHKNLVVYTSTDPHRKANAALLMSLWALVIGKVDPADAFYPFSTWEFEPFRDAGYGRPDFNLSIQDVIYGLHRGLECGLLDLSKFDIDEYEHYEQVQNGDWNWITPNFIAFASPNDKEYVAQLRANALAQQAAAAAGRPPPPAEFKLRRPMSKLMSDTIKYFRKKNVKLVVRLNNPLYDKKVFEDAGIRHLDLYFDDGSNPSTEILREFIKEAHEVVKAGGVIAVHCKAGLGRTGVLIGAYLIWKHGFTANEIIGFMRLMRPGCVVGPQQHFMYTQFVEWVRWGERARLKDETESQAKLEQEKRRIELELEQSRREVEAIKRQLAEAQSSSKGGLSSAKADEAARMRRKRKSSSDRDREDEQGDDVDDELSIEAGGLAEPMTPRPHKVANFRGASGDVSTETPTGEGGDNHHLTNEQKLLRTAPMVKPPPVVGQPRKSPSPTRKRTAQLQAPATESRLGSMRSGFGRSLVAGLLSMAGRDDGTVEEAAEGEGEASTSSDSLMVEAETPTHSPALDRKGKRTGAGASTSASSTSRVAPVRTSSLLRKNEVADAEEVDLALSSVQREGSSSGSSAAHAGIENANASTGSRAKSAAVVQPLMQSIHAGNVQIDAESTVVAARSMLTSDGKLALSTKETTISAYVRTGGMTSPSLKSKTLASPVPAGSTTPQSPPPLPTPAPSSRPAGVLARLNGHGAGHARTQSAVTPMCSSGIPTATAASSGAGAGTAKTLPLADDVFSSPPLAPSTSGDLSAIPPLFRASPEVRDRFGLRDSRLPTPQREKGGAGSTPVTSPRLEAGGGAAETSSPVKGALRGAGAVSAGSIVDKDAHTSAKAGSDAPGVVPSSTAEVRVVSTRTRPMNVTSTRDRAERAAASSATAPYVRPDHARKLSASSTSTTATATAAPRTRSVSGQRGAQAVSLANAAGTSTSRARVPSGVMARAREQPARKASATASSSGHGRSGLRSASGSGTGAGPASSSASSSTSTGTVTRRVPTTANGAGASLSSTSTTSRSTSSRSLKTASGSSHLPSSSSSVVAGASESGSGSGSGSAVPPAAKRPRMLATSTNATNAASSTAMGMAAAVGGQLPSSIEGRLRLAITMGSGSSNAPAPKRGGASSVEGGMPTSSSSSGGSSRGLHRNVRARRSSLGEADVDVQA